MLRDGGVHVAQGLLDDVVHELDGGVEAHAAVLQLGDGQQVLHRGGEPGGVRADVRGKLCALPLRENGRVGEKHVRVAGDGGERRAQVVGDRTQEVGPELLVLGRDGRALALLEGGAAREGKRRLAGDGRGYVGLVVAEGRLVDVDGQHSCHHGLRRGAALGGSCVCRLGRLVVDGEVDAAGELRRDLAAQGRPHVGAAVQQRGQRRGKLLRQALFARGQVGARRGHAAVFLGLVPDAGVMRHAG